MAHHNGSGQPMHGKVCLVTGATSGIGVITARELARMGATVVLVARNAAKGAAMVQQIRAATGNSSVEALYADLSSQEQIQQLADDFTQRYERLHVLVNNAGAIYEQRRESVDGIELTFALNHLSYFLLTNLLLDRLLASGPARVVNVASEAHRFASLNFDDLQARRTYRSFRVYSRSKLANILFTVELDRRLAGTGVTANALHPGLVASGFGRNNSGLIDLLFGTLLRPFAITPEQGSQTPLYLAASSEVEGVTGLYFSAKRPLTPSRAARDLAAARRLWAASEELTQRTAKFAV